MKFYLLFFLLFAHCTVYAQKYNTLDFNSTSTVQIECLNCPPKLITLYYIRTLLYVNQGRVKIPIEKKISTAMELKSDENITNYEVSPMISSPNFAIVSFGNEGKFPLYLLPNDTLKIVVDYSNPASMQVKYIGKSADISKFFYEKVKYMRNELFFTHFHLATVDNRDSLLRVEKQFLESYHQKTPLPQWFVNFQEEELKYYTSAWRYKPPNYNENAIFNTHYYYYLWQKIYDREIGAKNILLKTIQFADDSLKGEIREIFKAYSFVESFEDTLYPSDSTFLDSLVNAQYKISQYPKYFTEYVFKERKKAVFKTKKLDKDYSEIALIDESGAEITPKMFEGKVVLFNFWAVHCKPCFKSIPDKNKLVDTFKDQNFIFVNVCLNYSAEAVEKWQKALKKHQMNGLHVMVSKDASYLEELFNIKGFPHYTLVDETGLVFKNDIRLSAQTYDYIKQLLEKK